MMNRKIMHFVDALAATVGALMLLAGAGIFDAAQAANLSASHASGAQPVLLLLGASRATFPGTRRVMWPGLFSHHGLSECQDVAEAVRRVGLQQRVQAANLYMSDLSDEAIGRAFGNEKALLDWFGPAYADPKLRHQMTPEIRSRIETLARSHNYQLGHA